MNNKVLYYRGQELISNEDKERLLKIWGDNRGYNFFEEHEWNDGYNTGLMPVINIIATIENNEKLNTKDIVLRERIKKAKRLTKALGRGYDYVEQNLLSDLLNDALHQFNKENVEADSRLNPNLVPNLINEFFRIYNLPYSSIMKKVEAEEEKISLVPEPEVFYEIESLYGKLGPEYSQNTAFKEYNVKLKKLPKLENNKAFSKALYKKYPFIGKVYYSNLYQGEAYWQINVYDYFKSNNALQIVVNEMYTK